MNTLLKVTFILQREPVCGPVCIRLLILGSLVDRSAFPDGIYYILLCT